eukprot:TRINITY_DN23599_c0_g3_i1.p1 TRINITY_DN23599_c0_g3~~TRINITY_DN23599_c0_g3_i1.p1  ORF type:complete len:505 (+),score=150.44 TRINITY_DN23599_c0_g3_i1:27-1517(+)
MAATPAAEKPLHLYSGGFTTRSAENQKKANTRHVLIPNLAAVAKALKKELPALGNGPCGLFAVFEGEPLASEHCAKNMHVQLLQHLAKLDAKANERELKRALRGAVAALDQEVQDKLPGQNGCGGAVALAVGRRLLVIVVGGLSVATCCGPVDSANGTGGETAKTAGGPVQFFCRVKRNLGASESAAPKLGATGPQLMTAQLTGQVKGRPGAPTAAQVSVEDVKVLALTEAAHDCLILGSRSLLQGFTLAEVVDAVKEGTPGDALGVATAVGQKAKSRQVSKSSDKACWVQAATEDREITCCSVLFHFGEDLGKDVAQQEAKKQKVGAGVKPTESLAAAQERAETKKWTTRTASETLALGPVGPDGAAPVHVPEEAKIFDINELDGTAQWRMKNYGTAHFRGGENYKGGKGDDDGKGKGKGKKGKGKGKGKGKKGKKGKGKKRKKGEEDDEDDGGDGDGDEDGGYEEGGFEDDGDGDITGDEADDKGGIEIAASGE